MRILAVARQVYPDVQTGRSVAFTHLLEKLGQVHELRLVAGWHHDRSGLPYGALGVDLRGQGTVGSQLALWRASRSAMRPFDPHVVLSSGIGVPPMGRPTIAVLRDLVGTGWGGDAARLGVVQRARARAFSRIVVPTHSSARHLGQIGIDPARIRTIPEFVANDGRSHLPRTQQLRVVHAGRIHPAKCQHLSVDAISRLPAELKSKVTLEVVGHTADPRYVQQLKVAARGQPVTVQTDVRDLDDHLARADLLLYPTALSGEWPDVALRGMAAGVAVAWADHPSVREAVGGVGFPFPPGDLDALRAIVGACVDDEGSLEAEGAKSQEFVSGNYSWEKVWSRWDDLLQEVLRGE